MTAKFTTPNQPNFGAAGQQPQQQSTHQYQEPTFSSWADIEANLFDGAINSSLGSEVVMQAEAKFREQLPVVLDQARNHFKVDIIKIDAGATLPCSILVFTLGINAAPELGMAYHAVLVEATDDSQSIVTKDIGGQQIPVMTTIGSRYGAREKIVVEEQLRKIFPEARRLVEVDAQVLHRDFDLTNRNQCLRFVSNAVGACRNLLASRRENWQDLSIGMLGGAAAGLTARVSFNRRGDQFIDEAGIPLRSDIRLQMQTPEVKGEGGVVLARSETLANITGYVDLVYAPQAPQAQPGFGMMGQPQATQMYLPRMILTHLDMYRGRTIGGQLLALLGASSLYDNNVALSSLFPNLSATGDKLDLNDISALNIEANLARNPSGGERWKDLAAGTATENDVQAYLNALIYPTFEMAIDVSDNGADTWLNSIFVGAAMGNRTAIGSIIDAADQLTMGTFSAMWSPADSIVQAESRVPLGQYESNGKWRDARDCAYLPVLNVLGERNPRAIIEWSDAKTNRTMDPDVSLYTQRRITEAVLGSVVWTGVGTRLVFNPKFLSCLAKAFHDAGGSLRLNGGIDRRIEQRATYSVPVMNPLDFTSHVSHKPVQGPAGTTGLGAVGGRWANYR